MAKAGKRKRGSDVAPAPLTTKRIKVQAQRKFAQGALVIPVQVPKESYSSLPPAQDLLREATIFHVNDREKKTYTEDFLTFLCFKGSQKNRSRPAFPFNFQARLFVPNGVRKQASETPAPAPPIESNKSSSSALLQSKENVSALLNTTGKARSDVINRVQTRSKALKIVKTLKRKKPDGTVSRVKIVPRADSKFVYKKVSTTMAPRKRKTPDEPKKEDTTRLKKTKDKNKPKKTITKTNSRVESKKTSLVVSRHYVTRNNTVRREIVSAGDTGIHRTRSGAIRVTLPVKKKAIVKKSNTPSVSNPKKDFSSEDDEPLYKSIKNTKQTMKKPVKKSPKPSKSEESGKAAPAKIIEHVVVTRTRTSVTKKDNMIKETVSKKPNTIKEKSKVVNPKVVSPTSTRVTTRRQNAARRSSEMNEKSSAQQDLTQNKPTSSSEVQQPDKKQKNAVRKIRAKNKAPTKNVNKEEIQTKSNKRKNTETIPIPPKKLKESKVTSKKQTNESNATKVQKKEVSNELSTEAKIVDLPGTSGMCTRKQRMKNLFSEDRDDFTDSDEEPLVSKISDTTNKNPVVVLSTINQESNVGLISNAASPKLTVLIDSETREMADKHSKAPVSPDSIDSSFNLNNIRNGIIHTDTSSSSVDESGNVTVQPETLPPIETLRHVMKRGEHTAEAVLNRHNEQLKTENDRSKYLKTKEYIESWIEDISKNTTSISHFLWLMKSTTPEKFAEYSASSPDFAEMCLILRTLSNRRESVNLDDLDIEQLRNLLTEEERTIIQNELKNIQQKSNSSLVCKTEEEECTTIELKPSTSKQNVVESSVPTNTGEASNKIEADATVPPSDNVWAQPPEPLLPTCESLEAAMLPPAYIANTTQVCQKDSVESGAETYRPPVVSNGSGLDVYNFIESEMETANNSNDFGWKPMRGNQRVIRPIPTFPQLNPMPVTAPANVNPNVNIPSTSDGKTNREGRTFIIPLDGINKAASSSSAADDMIGGVAVKVGAPEGDKRVIMTAGLVTNSELDNTARRCSQLDNLNNDLNQTGQVRDMVNMVSASGSQHNVTPANVTVTEQPPAPPPYIDEMCSMRESIDTFAYTLEAKSNKSFAAIPGMNACFPEIGDNPMVIPAPDFHPSDLEFQDPLEYIEKITPVASKYGICKIIPPRSFQSDCNIWEDMRFTPYNQYVNRMLHRWGPSSRQMCAIKKYLSTQGVTFNQPPKLSGIEVDLPKLYHVVQSLGGLKRVLEKKMWMRVAEEMCIPFNAHYMDFRLDEIYCKYLLPYDTLSNEERQKLFESVDEEWQHRRARLLARAANPMNCPEEEEEDCREGGIDVTEDIEECVTRGKSTTLGLFARLAKNIVSMHFGKTAEPTPEEVETKFWEYVTNRESHVCVNSGSIDSSVWGYGFPSPKVKGNNIAKHPWNLKVLTNNNGSVLRSLGPMVGVTAPTLHVGMAFSACCWYRDPHGLPWIEYLHQGAPKVWYGVPATHRQKFRSALASIVPELCQQKTIWLLSDTAMVPPSLLTENGVSLCRTLQQPGEFVIVFPKAFSSNICTGYSVSESVYFALPTWLQTAHQDFTDIRNSCEPSMFSLERLMVAISEDPRSSYQILKQVLPALNKITQQEKQHRESLFKLGLKTSERAQLTLTGKKKMAKRQDEAEECQRCRTNLSLSMLYHTSENMAYCLIHGAEYLETNTDQVDNCKLIFMHSIEELQTIMSKLIQRINNLANKKTGKGKNQ